MKSNYSCHLKATHSDQYTKLAKRLHRRTASNYDIATTVRERRAKL